MVPIHLSLPVPLAPMGFVISDQPPSRSKLRGIRSPSPPCTVTADTQPLQAVGVSGPPPPPALLRLIPDHCKQWGIRMEMKFSRINGSNFGFLSKFAHPTIWYPYGWQEVPTDVRINQIHEYAQRPREPNVQLCPALSFQVQE